MQMASKRHTTCNHQNTAYFAIKTEDQIQTNFELPTRLKARIRLWRVAQLCQAIKRPSTPLPLLPHAVVPSTLTETMANWPSIDEDALQQVVNSDPEQQDVPLEPHHHGSNVHIYERVPISDIEAKPAHTTVSVTSLTASLKKPHEAEHKDNERGMLTRSPYYWWLSTPLDVLLALTPLFFLGQSITILFSEAAVV